MFKQFSSPTTHFTAKQSEMCCSQSLILQQRIEFHSTISKISIQRRISGRRICAILFLHFFIFRSYNIFQICCEGSTSRCCLLAFQSSSLLVSQMLFSLLQITIFHSLSLTFLSHLLCLCHLKMLQHKNRGFCYLFHVMMFQEARISNERLRKLRLECLKKFEFEFHSL